MDETPLLNDRSRKIFGLMLGAIFLTEFGVMYVLEMQQMHTSWWLMALLDATVLSLTVSGVLMWAIASPKPGLRASETRLAQTLSEREAAVAGLHPWKTFGYVVALVFMLNTAVMLLLETHPHLVGGHGFQEALAHGLFATIPIAGAVWWLVVSPLKRAVRRLQHAADKSDQVTRRLRESEARFRTLFESSWDAIMTLEPPSWKFTSANGATLKMFGAKDEAEFATLGPWNVSPPLQPDGRLSSEKAKEMIDTAMREGVNYFDWTHTRLGGGSFPATVLLTCIEQDGRVFLESTVRDVSAEVAAREAIAQANAELAEKNRELDVANRSKAEFLAAVSHELRTPLNGILGFAGLLEDGEAGALNERQADYLKEIRNGGKDMLHVVNAILDMSTFDVADLAHAGEAVDIEAIVGDAVAVHRKTAEKRGISIGMEVEPGANRTECNPRALRKALDHLLSNAVKFNHDGGSVTVSVRRRREGRKPGPIEIAVADTGIGIAAEDLPRLFQPFVQLDASRARRYGGIGIGLALVRRMAEACGGRVDVESEPGRGSVFTLRLPPAVERSEAVDALSPAPLPQAGEGR
jgi:PAS domain S-box-containing protein